MIDEIKKLEKKYSKICERLEQLNERAFELEKELMYARAKKAKQTNGKQ